MPETMTQEAPYPHALAEMVRALTYKPGWTFHLCYQDRGQGSRGLTLDVTIECEDTYGERGRMRISNVFVVPASSFGRETWMEWLFQRVMDVERHEAGEHFLLDNPDFDESGEDDATGRPYLRPFAPNHGPGWDPYAHYVVSTPEQAATPALQPWQERE